MLCNSNCAVLWWSLVRCLSHDVQVLGIFSFRSVMSQGPIHPQPSGKGPHKPWSRLNRASFGAAWRSMGNYKLERQLMQVWLRVYFLGYIYLLFLIISRFLTSWEGVSERAA